MSGGKLSSFRWTDKSEHSRDLIFVIVILGFGIMLVAKLAPYYQDNRRIVVYSAIQTVPNTPRELVEKINAAVPSTNEPQRAKGSGSSWGNQKSDRNMPSVAERPLFDGQAVILKVRSLNPF